VIERISIQVPKARSADAQRHSLRTFILNEKTYPIAARNTARNIFLHRLSEAHRRSIQFQTRSREFKAIQRNSNIKFKKFNPSNINLAASTPVLRAPLVCGPDFCTTLHHFAVILSGL